MKVIKCENHIPREIWGRVVKNCEERIEYGQFDPMALHYDLKSTDTFPLPEQGDRVEVLLDNGEWSKFAKWEFIAYCPESEYPFILRDVNDDIVDNFPYIRPVEKEEELDLVICDSMVVNFAYHCLNELVGFWHSGKSVADKKRKLELEWNNIKHIYKELT
jgi:hypothetical protein